MKRWQIILIVLICVLGAAVGGVKLFYELYLVPHYIEPIANKMQDYINNSDVIEELYDNADRLHEEGYIEDDTYSAFMEKYNKYEIQNTEVAKEVMKEAAEADDKEEGQSNDSSALTAKYASKRVGIEMIQVVDDDEETGNSQTRYSTERTTDRVKSEDVVEAKKVLSSDDGNSNESSENSEMIDTRTAYQKLKDNMTADEFTLFTEIMQKMDINTLFSYANDTEGLKEYMHSVLTDDQYRQIVNLGYKYAYVFLEDV